MATESKKAAEEAKAAAEAELDRMLAKVRGRESVDALFARLTEAIAQLPKREQEPRRITLSERLRQGVSIRLPLADAWQAWLDNPKKRNPSPETVEMHRAYWGRDEVKKYGHRSDCLLQGTSGSRLTAAFLVPFLVALAAESTVGLHPISNRI